MSNYIDTYQIHYTSIIFVHTTEHNQPQYLLVAPTALLKPVVEAILQNLLFSGYEPARERERGPGLLGYTFPSEASGERADVVGL
jgi:hypothetical protein